MLGKSEAGVGKKVVKLVVVELGTIIGTIMIRTIIGRETLPETKDGWGGVTGYGWGWSTGWTGMGYRWTRTGYGWDGGTGYGWDWVTGYWDGDRGAGYWWTG